MTTTSFFLSLFHKLALDRFVHGNDKRSNRNLKHLQVHCWPGIAFPRLQRKQTLLVVPLPELCPLVKLELQAKGNILHGKMLDPFAASLLKFSLLPCPLLMPVSLSKSFDFIYLKMWCADIASRVPMESDMLRHWKNSELLLDQPNRRAYFTALHRSLFMTNRNPNSTYLYTTEYWVYLWKINACESIYVATNLL